MPALVDANALPADKYGFRLYGVMAHLSDEQAAAVKAFHQSIGAADLATLPHCSIHNLYGPSDLEVVKDHLRDVAGRHSPFATKIDFGDLRWFPGGSAYSIENHPDLTDLHRDVVKSLNEAVQLIYPPDQNYWPHTTILLSGTDEEVQRAREKAPELKFDERFEVNSIELIGRIGPNRGGEYRVIESFQLKGN